MSEPSPVKEKPKKTMTTSKKSKDKYNGFAVPPTTRATSRWARHIYEMMKEGTPALLEREDVKKAYNDLVECLDSYAGRLESWKTPKYARYSSGIKPDANSYSVFGSLPIRFLNEYESWNKPDLKKQIQEDSAAIKAKYAPLYELIKRDLVHYMERKNHEINSKKTLEDYHRRIEKMEKDIASWEANIEWARKTICELAQKSLNIAAGPKLTVFDT
jgi:hypothetical protein